MNNLERILIYLGLVLAITASFWPRKSKTLDKLTIVNNKKEPVIVLSATIPGSGQIRVNWKDGGPATIIGNAGISLYGPGETEQVWLGPTTGNIASGGIYLYDKNRQCVTKIGGRESGGYVDLFTKKGMPLATLGGMEVPVGDTYNQVSAGGLATYGFSGKPIAAFGTTSGGDGALTLWDRDRNITTEYPLPPRK